MKVAVIGSDCHLLNSTHSALTKHGFSHVSAPLKNFQHSAIQGAHAVIVLIRPDELIDSFKPYLEAMRINHIKRVIVSAPDVSYVSHLLDLSDIDWTLFVHKDDSLPTADGARHLIRNLTDPAALNTILEY